MIKIQLSDGREVNAVEVEFETHREEWNEYRLADGGRVRVKPVVYKILRAVDDQGQPLYTPDGDPIIIARNNVIIAASE